MKGLAGLFVRVNLRHLLGRKLRTLLTVAGIASGVALVFSISTINLTLLQSFRSSVRDLAGRAEIEVAAADQTGLEESAVAEVESIEGVEQAIPVVRQITTVTTGGDEKRTFVIGITPAFVTLFPEGLGPLTEVDVKGGFGHGGRGLLLAKQVADSVGARLHDEVVVDTPNGKRTLEVSGLLTGRGVSALSGGDIGIMFLPPAQELFAKSDRVDSIYVVVDESAEVDAVEDAINERLGGTAVVGPPGQRAQGLERVYNGIGTLLSLAGTVALFVALFVVYNTMSMSLAERRREISMAIALGAGRGQLFGAFLLEALVLGVLAAIGGLAGGWLLARVLVERAVEGYRLLPITGSGPLVVTEMNIALAVIGGLAVSLIGAYLPARRLHGVAPVESLRPEAAYEWTLSGPGWARRTMRFALGAGALVVAGLFFAAFVLAPEQTWIPAAGITLGLTGVTLILPEVVPAAVRLLRRPFTAAFGTVGRLAGDALAKNPGRTTFTVAALVLTLGMVVGVGSALGSYERQVETTATALVGAPFYVTSDTYGGLTSDQPLPASLLDDIQAVEGVKFAYPLRFQLLSLGQETALMYAVPVEEALGAGATTELDAVTEDPSAFLAGLEAGGIAVSKTTADRHDLDVGEAFVLPTPAGRRPFEVAAIFNDLVSFDSMYMDYETYRSLWDDDKADEFGVIPEEGVDDEVIRTRLEDFVAEAGVSATVLGQQQFVERILSVVRGTFSLGRGIQFAALVVAALTIANTMFTTVLERRWEMGLERAVGMSARQLKRGVLLEAAGIGVIGAAGAMILGTATGFVMTQAMEAQFSWSIAFQLPVLLWFIALAAGVGIAAVAGVWPSRMAVRAPIIESLRYE